MHKRLCDRLYFGIHNKCAGNERDFVDRVCTITRGNNHNTVPDRDRGQRDQFFNAAGKKQNDPGTAETGIENSVSVILPGCFAVHLRDSSWDNNRCIYRSGSDPYDSSHDDIMNCGTGMRKLKIKV